LRRAASRPHISHPQSLASVNRILLAIALPSYCPAVALAVVFALLFVIPEGNLLLAFALAFLSVIPEGNLLLAFALAFLSVIPEGNLLCLTP
jgi:hypothetical protein